MRVVSVAVPVLTRDIDGAIARYEALLGSRVKDCFVVPDRRLTIALMEGVTLIGGAEADLASVRELRASFTVETIEAFEVHLRGTGATILQPTTPTPVGRNLIVRDVDGTVLEFVELAPRQ